MGPIPPITTVTKPSTNSPYLMDFSSQFTTLFNGNNIANNTICLMTQPVIPGNFDLKLSLNPVTANVSNALPFLFGFTQNLNLNNQVYNYNPSVATRIAFGIIVTDTWIYYDNNSYSNGLLSNVNSTILPQYMEYHEYGISNNNIFNEFRISQINTSTGVSNYKTIYKGDNPIFTWTQALVSLNYLFPNTSIPIYPFIIPVGNLQYPIQQNQIFAIPIDLTPPATYVESILYPTLQTAAIGNTWITTITFDNSYIQQPPTYTQYTWGIVCQTSDPNVYLGILITNNLAISIGTYNYFNHSQRINTTNFAFYTNFTRAPNNTFTITITDLNSITISLNTQPLIPPVQLGSVFGTGGILYYLYYGTYIGLVPPLYTLTDPENPKLIPKKSTLPHEVEFITEMKDNVLQFKGKSREIKSTCLSENRFHIMNIFNEMINSEGNLWQIIFNFQGDLSFGIINNEYSYQSDDDQYQSLFEKHKFKCFMFVKKSQCNFFDFYFNNILIEENVSEIEEGDSVSMKYSKQGLILKINEGYEYLANTINNDWAGFEKYYPVYGYTNKDTLKINLLDTPKYNQTILPNDKNKFSFSEINKYCLNTKPKKLVSHTILVGDFEFTLLVKLIKYDKYTSQSGPFIGFVDESTKSTLINAIMNENGDLISKGNFKFSRIASQLTIEYANAYYTKKILSQANIEGNLKFMLEFNPNDICFELELVN